MSVITFDTLKFAKSLEAAGLNAQQAAAFAEAQREAFAEMIQLSDLATKRDLAELKASLERSMADMKFDMLKWIVGLALGQIAVVIGLFLKLTH